MLWPSETIPEPPPTPDTASIIKAGFIDGFNPCALTAIVFLCFFLSVFGKTGRRIAVLGSYFVLAYFLTNFLIILGLLDLAVGRLWAQTLLRYSLFVMAVAAVLLGVFNLLDWWRYLKSGESTVPFLKYPAILYSSDEEEDAEPKVFWRRPSLYANAAGFLMSIFGSLWPPNYLLSTFHSGFFSGADVAVSFIGFLTYDVFFTLPLLLVFGLIFYAVSNTKILVKIRRSPGTVKIICAGMLLGWGLALIYLFW